MRYFKIIFGSGEVLFVKTTSIYRVMLWILRSRPMDDFYLVNVIEVNQDKTTKSPATFIAQACKEYYHSNEAYGDKSDEFIRNKEIELYKKRLHDEIYGTRQIKTTDEEV